MGVEQQYIELFDSQRGLIESHSADVLNARRTAARDAFAAHGLPTRRDERCKYTDVAAAFAPDYGLNLGRIVPGVDPNRAYRCQVPNLSTALYFVVNDSFMSPSPVAAQQPEGVTVCSLGEAARRFPDVVAGYYGRLADPADDGITALNTMLAQDGLFVHVAAGVKCPRTLQVVNMSAASLDLMATRRVLLVAEAGAEVSLLFCDHSDGRHNYLTTQVVEAFLGEGARVDFYSVEETHASHRRFCHLYADQQAGSRFTFGGITLMAGLTRNRLDLHLGGEGAEARAYGCVVADGEEHVDNNLLVDHAAPGCTSDLLYKYVLDDRATGVFAGHILVREGAEHTASDETNANLCASPDARMFTRPILEIYADDVRCNHGATVGRFDEQALFYMRQRGIDEAEARLLLQHAFVNDIIRRIELEPVRDRLSYLVEMRFRGLLHRCGGCEMCHS